MNPLKHIPYRPQAPMGSDGGDSGGVDRGDDFVPTSSAAGADDEAEAEAEAPASKPDAEAAPDAVPEEPSADEGAKGDPKKKDARIPLSRHKDLLEKERAKRTELEQKLAQYQQGKEVASLNEDITAAEGSVLKLEKEYATLLADGEVEKATALMAQIRSIERQMAEAKSDMKIAAAEARTTERARYDIALERIESAYPELNSNSDDYDDGLMNDVVDLKAAYEARRGLTPTAAMQKAVETLIGARTKSQEKALEVTPRVTTKDVATERKKEAVARTVAAVGKQPPSMSRVGMDSDKAGGALTAKDIMKMSQSDFAKLSDAELSRLRGDEV